MSVNPLLLGDSSGNFYPGTDLIVHSINATSITTGGNATFNHLMASTISAGSETVNQLYATTISTISEQVTNLLAGTITVLQNIFVPGASFSPSLNFAGGGTSAYSTQNGYYYRLGNVVFYNFYLALSTFTTTSPGVTVAVTLPVTPSAAANNNTGFVAMCYNMNNYAGLFGFNTYLQFSPGGLVAQLVLIQGGYASSAVALTSNNINTNSVIYGQGFYFV